MIKKLSMINIAIVTALLLSACGGGGGASSATNNQEVLPAESISAKLLKGKTFYSVDDCDYNLFEKSIFSETFLEGETYVEQNLIESIFFEIEYKGNTIILDGGLLTCTVSQKDISVVVACSDGEANDILSNTLDEAYEDFGCGVPVHKISEIVGLWDASNDMGIPTTQYKYIAADGTQTYYVKDKEIDCFYANEGGQFKEDGKGNIDFSDGFYSPEVGITFTLENGKLNILYPYKPDLITPKAPVGIEEVESKLCPVN